MKTTKKKFDCVESVRKERHRIADETDGMTVDQIMEYFHKRRKQRSPHKGKRTD